MERDKRPLYGIGLVLLLLVAGWFAFAALGRRAEADMNSGSGPTTSGPFETYWNANGGLARFGAPLTGVFETTDGYAAQYFERAVLIYDPNAVPSDSVQPEAVGWMLAAPRCTEVPFRPVGPPA